jgi:hypothetical protein
MVLNPSENAFQALDANTAGDGVDSTTLSDTCVVGIIGGDGAGYGVVIIGAIV